MKNTGLKVNEITIEKFRRFNNVKFELGSRITLIAGQNGTSKSTLLGMIAQPFSFGVFTGARAHEKNCSEYTKNYHGLDLSKFCDLKGSPFSYDCKDVFRLSKIHDTDPKKYLYRVYLVGNCIDKQKTKIFQDGLLVRGHKRPNETKIRFVAGPGKSSGKGEGNFPHPVIYLGLNRHWPLALAQTMNIASEFEMEQSAKDWFVKKYNQILLLEERDSKTEFVRVDGNKKGFVGVSGADYHSESFSAGQDNLVQILTAILSFRKLREQLGNKYQGGMILIDEIDSTLHAKAQTKLLEVLLEACEEYDLQIVGTTHSSHLLKIAFNSKQARSIKTIYLLREDNIVRDSGFTTFDEIDNNLQIKAIIPKKRQQNADNAKVSIVLEDKTAHDFFYNLFGRGLDKFIKRYTSPRDKVKSISSSYIVKILPLVEVIPELKKIILLPDGDQKDEVSRVAKKSNNIICLPSDTYLEKTLFNFLEKLPANDSFWRNRDGYTKQFAIVEPNSERPDFKSKEEEKKWLKRWYKEQSIYWGRGNKIVFEAWIAKEKKLCLEFCKSFLNILKKISSQTISTEVENRIISKFQ